MALLVIIAGTAIWSSQLLIQANPTAHSIAPQLLKFITGAEKPKCDCDFMDISCQSSRMCIEGADDLPNCAALGQCTACTSDNSTFNCTGPNKTMYITTIVIEPGATCGTSYAEGYCMWYDDYCDCAASGTTQNNCSLFNFIGHGDCDNPIGGGNR